MNNKKISLNLSPISAAAASLVFVYFAIDGDSVESWIARGALFLFMYFGIRYGQKRIAKK